MKKLIVMILVVVMAMVVAPKVGAVEHIAISGGTTWDCMGQYARLAERWYDGPQVTYGWWNFNEETGKTGFTVYMEVCVDDEVVEVPFATLEYNEFMQWLDEFDGRLSESYYECYRAMCILMCKWW